MLSYFWYGCTEHNKTGTLTRVNYQMNVDVDEKQKLFSGQEYVLFVCVGNV